MLTGSFLILGIFLGYWVYRWTLYRHRAYNWRSQENDSDRNTSPRHPPKPVWVKKEIIRLKALMPYDRTRKIAHTFNRLYAVQRHMTVGKTFVSYTIHKHQYEIRVLRRKLKHKHPRPVPKHLIWGVDLSYFTDQEGQQHPIMGIVEHGSRACLTLEVLRTKASIRLLRCVLDTIEMQGNIKPKYLRTDYESVFTSLLFRMGMWLVGIKLQRTEVCCPWQNGRIERFFGTLKAKTKDMVFATRDRMQQELTLFRFWYNHIRPHQYLDGLTPFEAYHGFSPGRSGYNQTPYWFEAWDGRLTGFWLKPG
jgi:Transposase and inactivated derivatives